MNPGDFMKNFFRDFSAGGDHRTGPPARREGVRLLEQATLGFTPHALTLPAGNSRKVAHYSKVKGKRKKAKEGTGLSFAFSFAFCLFTFAFLIHRFLVN